MIRQLIRIALRNRGYEVRRVAVPGRVYVADPGLDPITFEYLPSQRGYTVFEIPLADARAFDSLALPLHADFHPLVRAVEMALSHKDDQDVANGIEGVLRDYYERVQPSSACEVLGLPSEEAPGLAGVAPSGYLLPWSWQTLAEVKAGHQTAALGEGLQYGLLVAGSQGLTDFGPVKPAKLALEVTRLSRLLASIRSRGYSPSARVPPLTVAALHRDGQYKWQIKNGEHRFAVAAALGIKTLPGMSIQLVRREDARHWPRVADGVFTERGALQVFDRIFDAAPAPVCTPWLELVNGMKAASHVDR